MRFGVILLLIGVLSACTERGAIAVVPESVAGVTGTTERQIFVATTRQPSTTGDFSALRTSKLSFSRYDVSIPPTHVEELVEWPDGTPDPAADFVTTKITPYPSAATFGAALNQNPLRGTDTAIIYVHGYNTTFAEGTYQLAQIAHDMDEQNTTINYSWPATANALEYTRDRDSVLFARDGLERLLETTVPAGFDNVVLVAHSIGSGVVVEALRQISLQRKSHLTSRIGGVILISPDIDTNLFETQITRISPMPDPFIVFGNTKDRALKLSAFLTGRSNRVGQLKDPKILRKYGVQFLDVTDVRDANGEHAVAITSPTILPLLRELPEPNSKNTFAQVRDLQTLIDASFR